MKTTTGIQKSVNLTKKIVEEYFQNNFDTLIKHLDENATFVMSGEKDVIGADHIKTALDFYKSKI